MTGFESREDQWALHLGHALPLIEEIYRELEAAAFERWVNGKDEDEGQARFELAGARSFLWSIRNAARKPEPAAGG